MMIARIASRGTEEMQPEDIPSTPGSRFWESVKQPRSSPTSSTLTSQAGAYRGLPRLLSQFEPISLAETKAVALLDRTDTKYVMRASQLYLALTLLSEHYWVLDIAGNRMIRYRTLYFDTDDFVLFRHHHSGKPIRCKVRSREYVDTKQSFLEVKWKAKRDRTVKNRIPTTGLVAQWVPEANDVLSSRVPLEAHGLEPKLMTVFHRTTLVSKHLEERVTLDLGLQFSGDGRTVALPDVAIAEVKQDGVNRCSDFVRQMRAAGIRPSGFSKYCIGVSMLYQDVKHNRFKPKLRLISELMGGDHNA